ncbi:MAG: hypothetical protein JWP87_6053, partial [Labilithrix sp.]|nr:hypothetical protein [Labilithrix sp.]
MRSFVCRALAPLGAVVWVTALSSAASAEPSVHVAPSARAVREQAVRNALATHAPLVI